MRPDEAVDLAHGIGWNVDDQADAARRFITGIARDDEDRQLLLDLLGLLPEQRTDRTW